MRKFISVMLLAGVAATPAFAAPGDWSDRQQAREQRQQAREDRAATRIERQEIARPERVAPADRGERVERTAVARERFGDSQARVQAVGRADSRDLQAIRDARRTETMQQPMARERADMARQRIDQRMREAQDRLATARATRMPPVSSVPRPGTQPPAPTVQRTTPPVQWSSNWRHDNRYDWRNYRNRHRSLFNLGFYYDPFGWGYQPYMIGWRMWPSYYGSQYWLNDPWMYRLPYAPPGYRWVRYWDDAVLVDTWSGQVVDVIYNFFW